MILHTSVAPANWLESNAAESNLRRDLRRGMAACHLANGMSIYFLAPALATVEGKS
ncbi:MAG: hypothetical protein HQ578_04965 [Chloroflexi bacterium]|nr:hypothetical protein [Chloroflexota bacterium]